MPNYADAREKIGRADKHIRDFDAERVKFLKTNPYVVHTEFNVEEGMTHYVLGKLPIIPPVLALTLGDAAHSLRTSLDYLACGLVQDGLPTNHIYFPICESPEKYIAESPTKTKGIPPLVKEEMDKFRPYARHNDLLWGLHKLDIIDKHHLLLPVGINVANVQMSLRTEPTFVSMLVSPCILEEGYILGGVGIPTPETNENMKFTFDIAFGEPKVLFGRPVMETFTQMLHYVERMINHFEGKFS